MPQTELTERKTMVYEFYDYGWNARIRNEPFQPTATIDWKDGWRDCDELSDEKRAEIGEVD